MLTTHSNLQVDNEKNKNSYEEINKHCENIIRLDHKQVSQQTFKDPSPSRTLAAPGQLSGLPYIYGPSEVDTRFQPGIFYWIYFRRQFIDRRKYSASTTANRYKQISSAISKPDYLGSIGFCISCCVDVAKTSSENSDYFQTSHSLS